MEKASFISSFSDEDYESFWLILNFSMILAHEGLMGVFAASVVLYIHVSLGLAFGIGTLRGFVLLLVLLIRGFP